MSQTRRLAAILAADVAGYSRLIGANRGGTLQAFKEEMGRGPSLCRLSKHFHRKRPTVA
jgi:hypothetical protein